MISTFLEICSEPVDQETDNAPKLGNFMTIGRRTIKFRYNDVSVVLLDPLVFHFRQGGLPDDICFSDL